MSIYLDNAASTKVKPSVLKEFNKVAELYYGNPSSKHIEGQLADHCIETAKNKIADKFNCESNEIFFTTGATMSNQLLIQGVLRKHPECMFVTTSVEHNDIMELYDWLPYSKTMIGVDKNGIIDLDVLKGTLMGCNLTNKPCLVSIQMANSETGIIQPIKELSEIVHAYGGYLHMDATQYIPYYPIDMEDMSIDALSMSGQKIGGLKGSGLLVVRQEMQSHVASIIFGEQGLIGGTPSTPLIASLGVAFDEINYDVSSLQYKRDWLLSTLEELGGVLVGTKTNRLPNNIYIRFPNVPSMTLMNLLSNNQICVGTGSACSTDSDKPSHVALAYGFADKEALECIRFTLSEETTNSDLEYVAKVIAGLLSLLR